MTKCCYNHEEVNGVCLQNETTKDSTTRVETRQVTTANYNDSIRLVTEISMTKNSENADNLSKREWIVYSLCIGTVILLFGLSHLVRRYRKLKCSTQTSFTADVEIQHENKIERESQSIYDEIDDTLITENAVKVIGINISPKTNSLETPGQKGHETDHSESESGDKDGYLLPCISAYDSIKDDTDVYLIPCISEQDSIKDDTDVYIIPCISEQDSIKDNTDAYPEILPCISAQDSIKDDRDVYLIPCISEQESIKDNTHDYLEILPCISAQDNIKGDRDVSLFPCMFEQDSITDNNAVHLELSPCFSAQDRIKDDACSHSVSSNGSSSDSNFKLDPICNADYLNPYQALKYDNRPTSMHNYETSVIVHAVDCPLTFYDKTNTCAQSECHEREEDMSTDVKSEEAEEEYNDEAICAMIIIP
ncbi:Hypothetical predicted protein [Mytilus galloprovincialis]|uniref:Uncharacterized protein n=1 Tax=Mytilus galloprovincialis TaxID=29158 RepID=A0A8B6CH03_MYTGA|nr:Hypothetical predicted protein [Mytilus galloprovincialis]